MEKNFSITGGILNNSNPWYGKEGISYEKIFDILSKIGIFKGIELTYPNSFWGNLENASRVINNSGIKVISIYSNELSGEETNKGIFTSNDEKFRRKKVNEFCKLMDFTAKFNIPTITTGVFGDQFDYPFQVDYKYAWNTLIKSFKEITQYREDINIALKYKLRDPGTRRFLTNVGETLFFIEKVGSSNLGVCLDTSHSLLSQESMGLVVNQLLQENKLFQLDLDDCYRFNDDELIPGTVHFWEFLELLYYLEREKYDGFYNINIASLRDDVISSLKISVSILKKYLKIVHKIGLDKFKKILNHKEIANTYSILVKEIFKI